MEQKDKDFDLQKIKELVALMEANNLVEIEVKHGDDKVLLKRVVPQQVISEIPISEPEVDDENIEVIKSPTVGTFYETVGPESKPYVEIGSEVTSQTTVCIIEAMKVMNEIKAEITGTIIEVLAKNGQAIEYGQPLFKVRPELSKSL